MTKKNEKGTISAGTLTKGERFRIARRRSGRTQVAEATARGVTLRQIAAWEENKGNVPLVPALDKLSLGEQCQIARWRSGRTVNQVAKDTGVSRVTLMKQEADRTKTVGDLAAYWAARGWGTDLDE